VPPNPEATVAGGPVPIDAITDFAGDRAMFEGVLFFATGEAPPVAVADGFESSRGAWLEGRSEPARHSEREARLTGTRALGNPLVR
jgi:hypothetical protein